MVDEWIKPSKWSVGAGYHHHHRRHHHYCHHHHRQYHHHQHRSRRHDHPQSSPTVMCHHTTLATTFSSSSSEWHWACQANTVLHEPALALRSAWDALPTDSRVPGICTTLKSLLNIISSKKASHKTLYEMTPLSLSIPFILPHFSLHNNNWHLVY